MEQSENYYVAKEEEKATAAAAAKTASSKYTVYSKILHLGNANVHDTYKMLMGELWVVVFWKNKIFFFILSAISQNSNDEHMNIPFVIRLFNKMNENLEFQQLRIYALCHIFW